MRAARACETLEETKNHRRSNREAMTASLALEPSQQTHRRREADNAVTRCVRTRRLLNNSEDAEKLRMMRHGHRGLATFSEAEKQIEIPRQFGAEYFQLHNLPFLLLHT